MGRDYVTGTSQVISYVCLSVNMADTSNSENLPVLLLSKVRVSSVAGTMGTKQDIGVDASTLAKRCHIPFDKAANMVQMTT
jgi:hypothetical protein